MVDDPEMYSRISESFHSKATIRFVILLWGEKPIISNQAEGEIPIYSYKEIIDLGHKSCEAILYSDDASKSLFIQFLKHAPFPAK